ncbi:MAG: TlpA family protein disulfide reductase [Odoribacter sp.]|nr:TlpA family protein disulfide reductase [Odoribacter sp.]
MFCPFLTWAKDYQFKLHVKNLPSDSRPLLLRVYNGDLFVLDSVPAVNGEDITFHIPEDTRPGVLRAVLGLAPGYSSMMMPPQPVALNLIFNRENIEISTDYQNPQDGAVVLVSTENKLYFDFIKSDLVFYSKLGLLEQVVQNYPEEDEFYQRALAHYLKLQNEREKFIEKTAKSNTKTLASRIIKALKMPVLPGKLLPEERDSLFNLQYLSQVEFNDTNLLYTNVYTDRIFRFIQMYMKQTATPRENEANCIRALDRLVPMLDVNPVIQQHILQFLIKGFETMGMEEVLAHISSNYLQQCGSNSDIIKQRLEAYSRMAVGQKVPDFTLNDAQGQPFNLYDDISPYTLILFWHTQCGHCQMLMKTLPDLSQEEFFSKHQVRIVGVSVDENREDWEKFSETYPLDWVNTYTEGSFRSQVAADYNLFATPTMFLIDSDHNIISKPLTLEELKNSIGQLK